jgi:hypothetical protein
MTNSMTTPLRASYSTATAESVASFLATQYALPSPVECALLRRGFNDSFEVRAADGERYVLRLSCRRIRGEADVASETEFLTYLDKVGVPVAAPVPTRDGALLPAGFFLKVSVQSCCSAILRGEVQRLAHPLTRGHKAQRWLGSTRPRKDIPAGRLVVTALIWIISCIVKRPQCWE